MKRSGRLRQCYMKSNKILTKHSSEGLETFLGAAKIQEADNFVVPNHVAAKLTLEALRKLETKILSMNFGAHHLK